MSAEEAARKKSEAGSRASRARWDKQGRGPKASSGHEIDELDRAILAVLPDEGSKKGVYVPDVVGAPEIKRRLLARAGVTSDAYITTGMIGARLGLLRLDGLVISKQAPRSGGAKGWQRTEKGKREAAGAAEGGTA